MRPDTWRQRVPSASVLDDVLHHAKELLDIMDDELSDVDRNQSAELFAAAPILRQKLERLRDELRGGSVG